MADTCATLRNAVRQRIAEERDREVIRLSAVISADSTAELVYLRSKLFSRQDGFIGAASEINLGFGDIIDCLAKTLSSAGLWTKKDGGYWVTAALEHAAACAMEHQAIIDESTKKGCLV